MRRSASGRMIPLPACSPPMRATICGFSYRMNGNGDLERVEKGATAVAELGRIGAVDPVTDFGNGHGAEHDGNFSNHLLDTLDSLIWPQIPALGGNQDTGVQN